MDSATLEAAAAEWLARRDSGTWTDADEAQFSAWKNRDTLHLVAVLRLQAAWEHVDRLQVVGAGVTRRGEDPAAGEWLLTPQLEQQKVRARPVVSRDLRRRFWRLPRVLSIAAAVLFAVVSLTVWRLIESRSIPYRTSTGGMEVVTLADGSRITLNTDSVVRVTLGKSERRLVLERGEAYFEVAKDARRPFVVRVANERVVALGTRFSVLREQQAIRIVVVEGRVRIAETDLSAGSVARAGSNRIVVTRGSTKDAEAYLSWRTGYIYLDDTALTDAVREFNRYNEKPIVIAEPSLGSLRVAGNFRATNPAAFVRVLERNFPVRAQDHGDRIVIEGRPQG